ncbi:hypothetical protein PRIPAC_79545 [Pristionchus pacificus]|uniref:Uncharacterized protein n=1 Tax=Pristionchus pacificus TaxID=54126 RepID=A0A2A6CPW5_PRIPA|nr:hypothetical protein PRIPAC_79545 [Pristionchus pacificus]|eukprot:PDM80160.1 hypothetical protein PRIPAC_32739 [Pristionchus pacificus]
MALKVGVPVFVLFTLLLSFVQLGGFIALLLDWNEVLPSKCPSLAHVVSGGTAIFGSLSGCYAILTLSLFSLIVSHHFCGPRSPRILALTTLVTSGASIVLAGASFVSLEIVVRTYGIDNPCLAYVPYSHSIVAQLISFIVNAVLLSISLRRWKRRENDGNIERNSKIGNK